MPNGSGHIDGGTVKLESPVALEYFVDGDAAVILRTLGVAGDINKSFVSFTTSAN
jgi:hypothetical protein